MLLLLDSSVRCVDASETLFGCCNSTPFYLLITKLDEIPGYPLGTIAADPTRSRTTNHQNHPSRAVLHLLVGCLPFVGRAAAILSWTRISLAGDCIMEYTTHRIRFGNWRPQAIRSIACDPSLAYIAVGREDGDIEIFDYEVL